MFSHENYTQQIMWKIVSPNLINGHANSVSQEPEIDDWAENNDSSQNEQNFFCKFSFWNKDTVYSLGLSYSISAGWWFLDLRSSKTSNNFFHIFLDHFHLHDPLDNTLSTRLELIVDDRLYVPHHRDRVKVKSTSIQLHIQKNLFFFSSRRMKIKFVDICFLFTHF